MQLDWITTIAQVINFLVLVYLLKRFLYRPIVNAMNKREANIALQLDEAQQQSAVAQQQSNDYQEKVNALERQREQLIEDAKREAEVQRSQLMDELRSEIATIRSRWHDEVKREQQAFLAQARQMVGEQVCFVARRALSELADDKLENQMLTVFLLKLTEVPKFDKLKLAESATANGLTVESHFPISQTNQEKITAIIHQQIAPGLTINFKQVADLICGITLKGPGFKLEWNLDSYLEDIDERLSSQLAMSSAAE